MRSLRADRPRFAANGARAKTFGAGLEQAEQLWLASQKVDAIASPLLLFYGLTQAGRALCAAGTHGAAWKGAQQHGLHFELTEPAEGSPRDLTKVKVLTHGAGLVQQVAHVLGSPVPSDSASLSDLISSLDSDLYFDDEQYWSPIRSRHVAVWGEKGEISDLDVSRWIGPGHAITEPIARDMLGADGDPDGTTLPRLTVDERGVWSKGVGA